MRTICRVFCAWYCDDFTMQSPYIAIIAGEASGRLQGKNAVGAYWQAALARMPELRFELLAVLSGVDSLVVHYRSAGAKLAAEYFEFDAAGKSARRRITLETSPAGRADIGLQAKLRGAPQSGLASGYAFALSPAPLPQGERGGNPAVLPTDDKTPRNHTPSPAGLQRLGGRQSERHAFAPLLNPSPQGEREEIRRFVRG